MPLKGNRLFGERHHYSVIQYFNSELENSAWYRAQKVAQIDEQMHLNFPTVD
jgi:hypothetical protein